MQILIVDDDKTNILILSSMLKNEGYTVLEASNGLEALKCFDENLVDMVLMDIMMPDMDGYQAAKYIKERVGDKFIPIIFLTAISDENALAKCIEYGGDDFLTKPYNRIILRSKINALKRIRDLYAIQQKQRNELSELNNKIANDIQLANHVYKSLIKTNTLPKNIFETWVLPVSTFNGDIALVMRTSSGGYHVMLGDFTGHGMAAALGTIPVCDLFQDLTQRGYKIIDIIIEINKKLKRLLPTGYFCASVFISLNDTGSKISIFNAGMPKVMIREGKTLKYVHSQHLPLGIVDISEHDIIFENLNVKSKSEICVYSDGLIECKNGNDELYGYARLENILLNDGNIIESVKKDVLAFTDIENQEDDISLIEINVPYVVSDTMTIHYNKQYEWSLSYDFDADALKSLDPVMIIIDAILLNNFPNNHKDRIYTIITELFNNSLEHGLLALDSSLKSTPEGFSEYYDQRQSRLSNLKAGNISVQINNIKEQNGGRIHIELNDSGKGFDHELVIKDVVNKNLYSGRGIMLVHSICDKLIYNENGTQVTAEYCWEDS